MDLAFLCSVRHYDSKTIKLSYDIICQWIKKFVQRAARFPTEVLGNTLDKKIDPGIPKFHLPPHGSKCWSLYSLNFRHGWGRTDGEGIERSWAGMNAVASSTREMAPGRRHEFLDDQWCAANFRKVVGIGEFTLACDVQGNS